MQNSLQIQRYAISRTAEETLCCASSSRLSILFLLIQEYLRVVNPYLYKFTVPCEAKEKQKGCAACTAVKHGDGRAAIPEISFLAVSCHLSAQDRSQLIPTELWLSQASSKPSKHQLPASTSGQPANNLLLTLPMEKQACWNTDKMFNPWTDALGQLPDTNP